MPGSDFKLPIFISLLLHGSFFLALNFGGFLFVKKEQPRFQAKIIFEKASSIPKPRISSLSSSKIIPPKLSAFKPRKLQNSPNSSKKISVPSLSMTSDKSQKNSFPETERGGNKPTKQPESLTTKSSLTDKSDTTEAESASPIVTDEASASPGVSTYLPQDTISKIPEEDKQKAILKAQYANDLSREVGSNWKLPDFKGKIKNPIIIKILVNKTGKILQMDFVQKSDDEVVNLATRNAILKSIPFPPMPDAFSDETVLPITFRFSGEK